MFPVGNKLRIHLFGKSHAECLGCILEGFPTDFEIDLDEMDRQIALRKPSDGIGTPRKEKDAIVFEHGVKDGKTTDSTIEMVIYNGNRDSSAYSGFNITPRPGHSDLPALFKFKNYDVSGGAQFSGRMTAPLVAAGALAKQYLKGKGVEIHAFSKSIGTVRDDTEYPADSLSASESFPTRAMTSEMNEAMTKEIMDAREQKDSIGGIVECVVTGLPIGFGGEWFDALDVSIARMMMSIPAAKGVEFGKGFDITKMKGSESNDPYSVEDGKITALTNNMGGVVGGLSDGMPLVFRVAFKPTPSIGIEQKTVNLKTMENDTVTVKGRHDPCIVPRAVAAVEAMAALAVMDQELTFTSI